jgi:hypothetical protein
MAKILEISAKVSDCFSMSLYDNDTKLYLISDYTGYVPKESGVGRGDYIDMRINIDNGLIIGWKNPLENQDFCLQFELNFKGE